VANIVSIKFNDEETEILRRVHAASGVAGLSSHIKQVYFDAVRPEGGVLQELRRDLERVGATIERLREQQSERQGQGGPDESDLVLGILCGLYVMVRKSVGDSIRAQADQALDIAAIASGPSHDGVRRTTVECSPANRSRVSLMNTSWHRRVGSCRESASRSSSSAVRICRT